MTNNISFVICEETKKNLLEQIEKGDYSAITNFYSLFKIGELNFKSNSDDQFLVDLSSLTINELIFLHNHTKWVAPAFFLRLNSYGAWSDMNTESLLVLLETLSPAAKNVLFNRFECNLESASDELLVLMAQEEFRDSLDVLFVRYTPFVRNTIRKMKNKSIFVIGYDNDDLVQEGILGLYKSKNDYKIDRRTKFKDFSRNVIEKHIGTLVKKSTNYKNLVLNESLSYHSPIGSDPEETFEQLLKSETNTPDTVACNKNIFHKIKKNLTPLEKKVLKYYDQGYSYEEIGQMVDKNRKAIDNTIQRIRKKGKRFKTLFIDSTAIADNDKKSNNSPNLTLISHYLKTFKNIDVSVEELNDKNVLELAIYNLYMSELSFEALLSISNMNTEDFEIFIENKKNSMGSKTEYYEFDESFSF